MQLLHGDICKAYVYCYLLNYDSIKHLNIHKFNTDSIAWLDYIVKNRIQKERSDYDIVIGRVADARANELISEFIAEYGYNADVKNKQKLIRELHTERLVDQWCFKSNIAITILNNIQNVKRRVIQ